MTLEQPLVTVFTTAYNPCCAGTPEPGDQTMTDFEWLVVDDGSTDGTRTMHAGNCSALAVSVVPDVCDVHDDLDRGLRTRADGLLHEQYRRDLVRRSSDAPIGPDHAAADDV